MQLVISVPKDQEKEVRDTIRWLKNPIECITINIEDQSALGLQFQVDGAGILLQESSS